jgi:ABC-type transporter Mla subunit MlaD
MTTDRLKIVHEGLDNLEADVRLAQARQHPQEARQEDLARLTAEAVMSNYGNTMQAVTALGEKLKTLTKGLEETMHGLDQTMTALSEFVAKVGDSSHEITAKIDHANAVATEIRQWADGMTAKLK